MVFQALHHCTSKLRLSVAVLVCPFSVAVACIRQDPDVKPMPAEVQLFQYVVPPLSVCCIGSDTVMLPFMKVIWHVAPGVVLQTETSVSGEF